MGIPRPNVPKTRAEAIDFFLGEIYKTLNYILSDKCSMETTKGKLDLLVFDILVLIDGDSPWIPKMELIPIESSDWPKVGLSGELSDIWEMKYVHGKRGNVDE